MQAASTNAPNNRIKAESPYLNKLIQRSPVSRQIICHHAEAALSLLGFSKEMLEHIF
jgi:hypothetical protein